VAVDVDAVAGDGAEAAVFGAAGRMLVGAGALGAGSAIASDGAAAF